MQLLSVSLITSFHIMEILSLLCVFYVCPKSPFQLSGVSAVFDITESVGCRVEKQISEGLWEQTVDMMWARSELESNSAGLWLPLCSHRAPSGCKPATVAQQLLELYCSQ